MEAFYREQRNNVSLLLSHGHRFADRYPLGYLWNEVRFAKNRVHAIMRTEAVLMNATIVQALSGGNHLTQVLEDLSDG